MAESLIDALPDGTVTLMLTDVVSSTLLWEASPEAMALAIDRHYELMDAAITLHNGVRPVEQGEGDSVVAAFRSAIDAIGCGLDVQRVFAAELWPDARPLHVRMAIHTGQVLLRDEGNYFGPTIIRCARLRSLAHGGQILVSEATRAVVADSDLVGSGFLDLGTHRLKGLDRAERVWQLTHDDLELGFPALQSIDTAPTNLPTELSSLVGREQQVSLLRSELSHQRLITLTGSGGCGKTRLAFRTATEELAGFPDGVWCVELASVGNPDQVTAEIAGVLGLREEFGRPLFDTLAEQMRNFDGLLVVDNCEQVLEGVRSTLDHLLKHCPTLRVLATSREPLGLAGEAIWRVPSLDMDLGVELFVQRAQSARPGFQPSEAESLAIADIVTRLDGIPLAIELAAARVRMMSPTDIAAALSDRFRLLTGGSRTAIARQQTLEASVAWSYDLLDEGEKLLALRLAVMSGFTLDAAEEVAADDRIDSYEVLDLLTRLVDKSVVQVDHARAGTGSGYRILESVRQYLQARLIDSGEVEEIRSRHLSYFLSLAERVAPEIAFRDSAQLLGMLETEHDNLESALEFADTSGRREQALRLATSLTLFWELRGHLGRAGRWFARLLDQREPAPTMFRGRACWGAAHIALYSGDIETMAVRAPEALEQAELFDDDWARARALNTVGYATAVTTPDQARPGLERSIELGRGIGDEWAVMNSQKMITAAAWAAQDEGSALEALETLRRHAARFDAAYFLAWYHGLLGTLLAHRGDLIQARMHLEVAIETCDRVGEPITGGVSRAWLWAIDIMEGDYAWAEKQSTSLLRHAHASGGDLAIPNLLANLGLVAIARGDAQVAVDLLTPEYEVERHHRIPFLVAVSALVLASARRRTGDLDGAVELLDDLAGLAKASGNEWVGARVDQERAHVALDRNDLATAERLAHLSLAVFVRLGRRPDITAALDALGFVAAGAQSAAEALRCFAAAATERSRLGLLALPPDAEEVTLRCAEIRAEIGEDATDEYWAEGALLGLEEAVEYVSRARGERKRPNSGWASLTPTELRVVDLVAEGMTNPQIAEKMFIARGTVKVHISHVFTKLGVAGRAELAAMSAGRLG